MTSKAAFFDLDGTLVRTPSEYISRLIRRVMLNLGQREITPREAAEIWFASDMDAAVSRFTEELQGFWELFRRYDSAAERILVARPYEDVSALGKLERKGIKLGIITSAPKEIADLEIRLLKPIKFETVIYAQPIYGIRSKPSPEGINRALQNLNMSAADAIYVGNGTEDMETAQNAGVLGIFVKREEYPYLVNSSSFKIISTLHELE